MGLTDRHYRYREVFTGPNGETFLPPKSFAKLDSYVNELMQSEYLISDEKLFHTYTETEFTL